MFDELVINHVWIGICLWMILFLSDHVLTLAGAHLYELGANKHVVYEFYELNPLHQKDISERRQISPTLVLNLAFVCALLWLTWFFVPSLPWEAWRWNVYRVMLGAVLLIQFPIHERHVRNIVLFMSARDSRGLRGQIHYSALLAYRLSFANLATFAGMFMVLFLLTESWYFVGGAGNCFAQSLRHLSLSRATDGRDSDVNDKHPGRDELTT